MTFRQTFPISYALAPLAATTLFLTALCAPVCAHAKDAPIAMQPQAAPVLRRPDLTGGGAFNDGGGAQMTVVTDATAPGGAPTFFRFTVPTVGKNQWDVQYMAPTRAAITAGQKLVLHFWTRSRTKTPFTALVEDSGPAYDKAVSKEIMPGPDWQEVSLAFSAPVAYGSGTAHLSVQMGTNAGEIDIAGLRLESADAAPVAVPQPAALNADVLKGTNGFTLVTPSAQAAQATFATTTDLPGGVPPVPVARVQIVTLTGDAPYKIQLSQKVDVPVAEGQILALRFWARSSTKSPISAIYERASEPYDKPLARPLVLSPEWKSYSFNIKSPEFGPSGAQVNFQLGAAKGNVEIAGVRLINYGVNPAKLPDETARDYYGGLRLDNSWRASANARIEKYRKGGLVVRVVDKQTGKPVSGADVTVAQQKHAFRWGVALSEYPLFAQTPDGEKYRALVQKLFNYAVLENALKWNSTAPDAFDTADKMLNWCREHNIPVRGHNLFWAGYQYMPQEIQKLKGNGAAIRKASEAHVKDYVARTKGRVVVWDVVNEAVANTDVAGDTGRDLLADTFKWAHETDPTVPLAYNENTIFTISSNDAVGQTDAKVDELLHFLMVEKHAPVQVLGIQSHMGGSQPLVPGGLIAKNLEHWDAYKIPLEITEFDASIPDDKTQADYYDQFMTAVFADSQVTSFVQWGFWEGAHWLGKQGGAIYRRDFSPRPAAQTYERLVFHDWWTNTNGATSKNGDYKTRAFLGTYQITARKDGKTSTATAEVTKNENGETVATIRL